MEREDQEQAGTRAPHNAGVLVYFSFPIDEKNLINISTYWNTRKIGMTEALYTVGG